MMRLSAAPATEPVTLAEAEAYLRVDPAANDILINALIVTARQQAEFFTQQAIITQTWKQSIDHFPANEIPLKSPLVSVTSVTYIDINGTEQTLSTDVYQVDTVGHRIFKKHNQSWPSIRSIQNAVTVTFVCGYGNAAAVPISIKQAILLLVGEMYAHREESITGASVSMLPLTSERLLSHYRDYRYVL